MVFARVTLLQDRKGGDYICPQTVTTAIYDPQLKETLQQMLDRKTGKDYSVAEWESTYVYKNKATVVYGDYHTLFMSKKDNNHNHIPEPLETEWWTPVKGIDPTAPKVHAEIIPVGSTTYVVHHGLEDDMVLFSLLDLTTKRYVNATVEHTNINDLTVTFAKPTQNEVKMFIMASPKM